MNSLNPVMRIDDQIIDAIVAHECGQLARRRSTRGSPHSSRKVGLPPTVAGRYPHELSGGMKQRAVMAISTVPRTQRSSSPTSRPARSTSSSSAR